MFKILICEGSLTYQADILFKDYKVDIALNQDDIYDFTYVNDYNLIIINYYFYNTILELKPTTQSTPILFVRAL